MQEDKKPQGESFSFIQENVVPRKKPKKRRILRTIVSTLGLAVLFGAVASVVICFFVPSFAKWAGILPEKTGKKQIIFSAASPSPAVSVEPSPSVVTPAAVEESVKPSVRPVKTEDTKENGTLSGEDVPQPTGMPEDKKDKKSDFSMKDYQKMYMNLSGIAEELSPSFVRITNITQQKDIFDYEAENTDSFYGLVLADNEEELLILTSAKRIDGAKKLKATFQNGSEVAAEVYGKDKETGIAVLSVPIASLETDVYQSVKIAELGESYHLKMGMPVMALGSPNGYVFSMEAGMVTNGAYEKYVIDQKVDLYNTDMTYHPSGEGVVVDINGKVVGILTNNFQDEKNKNMCTFFGISGVKHIIQRLVNQEKRIYFGAKESDISTKTLEEIGLTHGIYVTEVAADSPALEAGIKNGDVITEVDGKEISTVSVFTSVLNEFKDKDVIQVTVIRTSKAGKPELKLDVILGKK